MPAAFFAIFLMLLVLRCDHFSHKSLKVFHLDLMLLLLFLLLLVLLYS